jgi:hypothetical protein
VGRACLDRQYARWGDVAMTYYNGNPYREDSRYGYVISTANAFSLLRPACSTEAIR